RLVASARGLRMPRTRQVPGVTVRGRSGVLRGLDRLQHGVLLTTASALCHPCPSLRTAVPTVTLPRPAVRETMRKPYPLCAGSCGEYRGPRGALARRRAPQQPLSSAEFVARPRAQPL